MDHGDDHHDDDFPQELAELRQQHFKDYPHRPMHYEPALIARIVAYIWARRRKGETLMQCSEKLSLPASRLRRWLCLSSELPPAPALPPPSLLRPVEVTAQMVRIPDGIPEKRYTLHVRGGFQVRGLRLQELVVLLKGLT